MPKRNAPSSSRGDDAVIAPPPWLEAGNGAQDDDDGDPTGGDGRRSRSLLPSWTVLPTMCTLGNLVAGFAAIFYATKSADYVGPWGWSGLSLAGALVLLGMALDAVDGALARLTRAVSELGSQLDSFADVITFVVAPAFMTLMLVRPYLSADAGLVVLGPEADTLLGKVIWGAAAVYVCCGAMRLARFNVEVGGSISNEKTFHGLPSPGAAGMVVSLVILHQHLLVAKYVGGVTPGFAQVAALGVPFVMLVCGILMVSSIPYVHFANRFIHGRRSFGYVARVVVVVLLVIWWFQAALAIVFTAYVLSGPVLSQLERRRR